MFSMRLTSTTPPTDEFVYGFGDAGQGEFEVHVRCLADVDDDRFAIEGREARDFGVHVVIADRQGVDEITAFCIAHFRAGEAGLGVFRGDGDSRYRGFLRIDDAPLDVARGLLRERWCRNCDSAQQDHRLDDRFHAVIPPD
jgi:hypothetical protein